LQISYLRERSERLGALGAARDDKFLELAVNGEASLIITGDADLLDLDPFQGIPIITPASYFGR